MAGGDSGHNWSTILLLDRKVTFVVYAPFPQSTLYPTSHGTECVGARSFPLERNPGGEGPHYHSCFAGKKTGGWSFRDAVKIIYPVCGRTKVACWFLDSPSAAASSGAQSLNLLTKYRVLKQKGFPEALGGKEPPFANAGD